MQVQFDAYFDSLQGAPPPADVGGARRGAASGAPPARVYVSNGQTSVVMPRVPRAPLGGAHWADPGKPGPTTVDTGRAPRGGGGRAAPSDHLRVPDLSGSPGSDRSFQYYRDEPAAKGKIHRDGPTFGPTFRL